jgi:DNA polymerase
MATTIEVNSCELCPLHELRRADEPARLAVGTVLPEGYNPGGIMVVLDQPNPDDEVLGKGLSGDAGALTREFFQRAGIDARTVAFDYMVHCRPPRGRLRDRPDALAACLHHLQRTMAVLRPGLVIVMGALGTKEVLTLKHAVSRDHGTVTVKGPKWDWAGHSPVVMVTYSPAAALFSDGGGLDGEIGTRIVDDLKAALDLWREVRG